MIRISQEDLNNPAKKAVFIGGEFDGRDGPLRYVAGHLYKIDPWDDNTIEAGLSSPMVLIEHIAMGSMHIGVESIDQNYRFVKIEGDHYQYEPAGDPVKIKWKPLGHMEPVLTYELIKHKGTTMPDREIPEVLREFISTLNNEQFAEIIDWADSNPLAIDDLIKEMAEAAEENCKNKG